MTTQSFAGDDSTDELSVSTRRWRWPTAADPAVLERLARIQDVCLVTSGLIAILVLFAWLAPSMAPMLFKLWVLMKADTAVLILLTCSSLALSRSSSEPPKREFRLASQALAAIVILTAAAVLVEYIGDISIGIDTILAADKGSFHPGRMSPQTASAFVLLGLVLLFIRVTARAAGLVVDFLVLALSALVMFVVSGYAFGVINFFGLSPTTRTSPHTLLALILLSFVVICRRAECGFYSVLAGAGIGSRIARIAVPLGFISPFGLEFISFGLSRMGVLTPRYATALVAALAEITCFLLILLLAWRLDSMELEIRDLSLRDDLTQLYNRRGFFLMAEGQLRFALRGQIPFSVLFLDLDGLKTVNDTFGHEAGNDLLKEAAALIGDCFRETDVVGRIGGDEFVVAAVISSLGISQTSRRLYKAAYDRNAEPGHPCSLQFSLGVATLDESRPESLKAIVGRADEAMYLVKRSRDHARS